MRNTVIAVLYIALCCAFMSAATARVWKPGQQGAAREYLTIQHFRPDGQVVMVMWVTPVALLERPYEADDPVVSMLTQFAMFGVVHFNVNDLGEVQFTEPIGAVLIKEFQEPRQPITSLPPFVSGLAHTISTMMASGLGQAGEGFKWLFFEDTGIEECKPGRFWIQYDDERYEYETPVPGCS